MTDNKEILLTRPLSTKTDPIAGRVPFFYGWLMLPIATVALIATAPGQTFGISVFNPSFREALDLSHSQLTGAYMLGTLIAAVPQSWFGALMDRFGIRRVMTAVVLLFGAACLFTAQVQNLAMLFVAFLSLRMFGQGALSLLANNTLAMWFDRRLGVASGVMNIGMALATGLMPAGILWLVTRFGWRSAYMMLGVGVWLMLLPLLGLLARNRPADVGQQVDGLPPPAETADPLTVPVGTRAFTPKEAMRTRAYWLFLLTYFSWAMIVTAVTFNIIPLFENRGLTAQDAAGTFTTLAFSGAIMQLAGGWLADHMRPNRQAVIAMLFFAAGIALLLNLDSVWIGHGYALALGIGQGLLTAVNSVVWVRYFGRPHLGKIRGSVWSATVAGSSLGPFVMGFTFDQMGSYAPSLWFFLGIYLLLGTAVFFAHKPQA